MATTAPAAAGDARDSEPLLPTHVDGADVEPMSERMPGQSKPAFGSIGHSIRARVATTVPTSPPPSHRPTNVSTTSLLYPPDAQLRQTFPMENHADQRRYRLALVWSYAPDWCVSFCLSRLNLFAHAHYFMVARDLRVEPNFAHSQLAITPYLHPYCSRYRCDIDRLLLGFSVSASRAQSDNPWWCALQSIHLHQHRACFSLLDYIQGFWREFSLTDTTIQHTFTVHERVPVRTIDFSFFSIALRVHRTGCCLSLQAWLRWLLSPSSTSVAFDRGGTSIVAGLAVRPLTTEFYSPSL